MDEITAIGNANTVIAIEPDTVWLQPDVPEVTLTNEIVVFAVYVPVRVAVPEPLSTIVWFGPPLTVYVTVAFGVPVKVTVALLPEQIVVLAATATVGDGNIVMVTVDELAAQKPLLTV